MVLEPRGPDAHQSSSVSSNECALFGTLACRVNCSKQSRSFCYSASCLRLHGVAGVSDRKDPRLRLSLDADTAGESPPPPPTATGERQITGWFIAFKGGHSFLCFYGWNLGFPQCRRWRAPSQAARLAYRISHAADNKQKSCDSLFWTEMCLVFKNFSNFVHWILEPHSLKRRCGNVLHPKGAIEVKWQRFASSNEWT